VDRLDPAVFLCDNPSEEVNVTWDSVPILEPAGPP
jgi:hypothetical protein